MRDFLKRHLEFFNAHPYLASFALGSLTRLEEQSITHQWKDKKPILQFKQRIMSPLGALGDAFFWHSIKPLSATIGLILSLYIGFAGVITFLIVYNIPHLYYRTTGIVLGYRKGFDIIRDLSFRGTQRYYKKLNYVIVVITSVMLTAFIDYIYHSEYGFKGLIVFLLMLMISTPLTFKRRITIELIITITLIISITVGLIL